MDVVIVGGGMIGASTAHALATRGATVTVLEKGVVGAGNTERSAGGIRTQFATEPNITLARESVRVWETFDDNFGTDIDFRRNGYLFVATTPETADHLRENVHSQQSHGLQTQYLDGSGAQEVCPGLQADQVTGAAYSPTDGLADPHLALHAYAAAARAAGARIHTNTTVTAIERDADRVTAVHTTDDRYPADYVVNAAGAWAGHIASLADTTLPITTQRLQVVIVDPTTPVPESVPMTLNPDLDVYFHPDRDGRAIVGSGPSLTTDTTPPDPDTYRTHHDLPIALEAIDRTATYTTYFGDDTRIRTGWAGLIASTPDNDPIIEHARPGFVTAAGFSGHGFMLAPAVGRAIADLLLDEHVPWVDLDAFRGDRFRDDQDGGHRWLTA